jgi:phosphatidylserine decarboxylase
MKISQNMSPCYPGSFLAHLAGFISVNIWSRFFTGPMHLALSSMISHFYNWRVSRYLIPIYCRWQYGSSSYYKKFKPGSNGERFNSFQDFFTRNLYEDPEVVSDYVWPAEGYLCEVCKVHESPLVKVKGEVRHISTIFGREEKQIDRDYYFTNVFLHNNNYHHIHAPVTGVISRIERIPGQLLLLRPWAYKDWPSLPALTNERINVDICDDEGRSWMLSIVGGPLVASIKLVTNLALDSKVTVGMKIASFELGSTCCMISPIEPSNRVGSMVNMGDPLNEHVNSKHSF